MFCAALSASCTFLSPGVAAAVERGSGSRRTGYGLNFAVHDPFIPDCSRCRHQTRRSIWGGSGQIWSVARARSARSGHDQKVRVVTTDDDDDSPGTPTVSFGLEGQTTRSA